MACHRIDYASVELLVKAGADVKAVDEDLNTAILLAASSPEEDHIPTKDLSPSIFKVFFSYDLVFHLIQQSMLTNLLHF